MAVLATFTFFNYKISKIARIIAYQETETKKESIIAFIIMIICVIFWTLFFSYYV